MSPRDQPKEAARVERLEDRLAIPVLVAAVVCVPAVFLTMTDGVTSDVGHALNWASMVVIVGESVLLLFLSGDAMGWARRHRLTLLVAVVTVPAVVFAVGPMQLLRLVLYLGAFRILRVGRIFRAGRIISRRTELDAGKTKAVFWALTCVAAVFVAVTLADPSAESRRVADWTVAHLGIAPAIVAGILLAAATTVAVRYRKVRKSDPAQVADPHHGGGH